jgi:hypothetical protein
MGYRFSKQASLASFSLYYLLFGRHPVLPKAIQADADTVLANMDNPDTWALVSEQRAELFKRVMPMALENLSIAQHRDTLRYATIRGGGLSTTGAEVSTWGLRVFATNSSNYPRCDNRTNYLASA